MTLMSPNGHLVIVGATASGKSAIALEVARRRPGVELVSMDSMALYRGMDIGTAAPTAADRAEVPHHLLDLVDPTGELDLGTSLGSAMGGTFHSDGADLDIEIDPAQLLGGPYFLTGAGTGAAIVLSARFDI